MKKILLLLAVICCSCEQPEDKAIQKEKQVQDHHSYSQPELIRVSHMDLKLVVDFDNKSIAGVVDYTLDRTSGETLTLDVRNLIIKDVADSKGEKLGHHFGREDKLLGKALNIIVPEGETKVRVFYETSPDGADALDWLEPIQTADKKYPFLYTQGQAILTRTWIPCQDSPGVRSTYTAKVKVPRELMAVMSASNPSEKNNIGVYEFEMKQAIPSYLIALAVGDLRFGAVGPRTGVYAEPSVLEKAVYEFGEMEQMLEVAEGLYGPYLWERYDVIVLPPSFPFGGMENPRLTFATPTILAGDRSLTSLIAHELAHSWSGNLVTNATWDDFWLNEGFTVYFERRIMEALYGKEYFGMLQTLGYQDLLGDVKDIGHTHEDTHLKLNLKGRDPDDGMTDIAYEKGAFFLEMLESEVGRERFDRFITEYFESHRFQSMTTDKFLKYIEADLLSELDKKIDLEEWIFGPGLPENLKLQGSDKFEKVDQLVKDFQSSAKIDPSEMSDWSTHEYLHFIRSLPQSLEASDLKTLDKTLNFSNSGNSEIFAAWMLLSIENGYLESEPQLRSFLNRVGRRKFLMPLYRALKENGQLELAKNIYAESKQNYHAVSTNSIDQLLEI